jgi:hypothetical protein
MSMRLNMSDCRIAECHDRMMNEPPLARVAKLRINSTRE